MKKKTHHMVLFTWDLEKVSLPGARTPTSSLNSTREDRVSQRAIATKPPGRVRLEWNGTSTRRGQNHHHPWLRECGPFDKLSPQETVYSRTSDSLEGCKVRNDRSTGLRYISGYMKGDCSGYSGIVYARLLEGFKKKSSGHHSTASLQVCPG